MKTIPRPYPGEYLPYRQDYIELVRDDGLVPRKFTTRGGETATQLTLFEHKASYGPELNSGMQWNLEV